ncbi:hypothetical protein CAter282_3150 [Collimonas arenae]|uniref:Uncharacterized protein n=1 Tax=Collimonas arenae TaxID=279058 RepID=A0A127QLC3_9BURK|nr:hypothetical protein [Collimonas arenae]AMP10857.1 hypothetical protein CAter282_3150 [Collimonas arenae]
MKDTPQVNVPLPLSIKYGADRMDAPESNRAAKKFHVFFTIPDPISLGKRVTLSALPANA